MNCSINDKLLFTFKPEQTKYGNNSLLFDWEFLNHLSIKLNHIKWPTDKSLQYVHCFHPGKSLELKKKQKHVKKKYLLGFMLMEVCQDSKRKNYNYETIVYLEKYCSNFAN